MKHIASTPPALVTRREAARFLNVSERQVWNLQNDGRLPHVRIGRSVRFRVTDLEAFIAARTVQAR